MVGLLMNDELGRTLNGAIVAYFKVSSRYSPEETAQKK
jgi:hypothetical protein